VVVQVVARAEQLFTNRRSTLKDLAGRMEEGTTCSIEPAEIWGGWAIGDYPVDKQRSRRRQEVVLAGDKRDWHEHRNGPRGPPEQLQRRGLVRDDRWKTRLLACSQGLLERGGTRAGTVATLSCGRDEPERRKVCAEGGLHVDGGDCGSLEELEAELFREPRRSDA